MKLSEFFSTGMLMNKKARLLKDITFDNTDEVLKKDTIGYLLKDFGDGYHFEDNNVGCKVVYDEVEILE